jgi:hypothetical protein
MRLPLAAVAALCLLTVTMVVFPGPAWAQSGVDLNPIMSTVVAPLAVTVLSGVASAFLAVSFGWLRRKWGIDIEANHREALHSAIVTGINLGVAKTGQLGSVPKMQVGNPLTRIALEYALRAVPDAIKAFNLTPEKVEQMILAKIPQVMGTTAASVSPPVSS